MGRTEPSRVRRGGMPQDFEILAVQRGDDPQPPTATPRQPDQLMSTKYRRDKVVPLFVTSFAVILKF